MRKKCRIPNTRKSYVAASGAGEPLSRHGKMRDTTQISPDEVMKMMKDRYCNYMGASQKCTDSYEDWKRTVMKKIWESFNLHSGIQVVWNGGEHQYPEFDVRWGHPCSTP